LKQSIDSLGRQLSTQNLMITTLCSDVSTVKPFQTAVELKLTTIDQQCKSSQQSLATQESSICRVIDSISRIDGHLQQHISNTSESTRCESSRLRTELSVLKTSIDSLGHQFSTQHSELATQIRFLSRPLFDSSIVPMFPMIFEEFDVKSIRLLFRGSRDGFSSSDFHRCCDNISNTLTIILTTNGSIFGGFASAAWSSSGGFKSDPT
jgi:hypothetical protein